MSEETDQLKELRAQILSELKPLLVSSDIQPEQKFTLLLTSALNTGDYDDFSRAKEAALEIEDTTSKANALLDLLGAVDIEIGDIVEDNADSQEGNKLSSEEQPQE